MKGLTLRTLSHPGGSLLGFIAAAAFALVLAASAAGSTPTISDPANSTVTAGGTAQFSVTPGGSPTPTLQWQRQPAAGGGFSNLTSGPGFFGVTGSLFAIFNVTSAMNGDQFRCVATNSDGSVTSAAATLTVFTPVPPVITDQPQSVTVNEGGSATFAITATSATPITYQWQVLPGGGPWTAIADGGGYSGTTTNTLTLTGIDYLFNRYLYRCVATNTDGPTISNGVQLTVIRPPALAQLVAGRYHSLRVNNVPQLLATGTNTFGQLGTGDTTATSSPVLITLPGGRLVTRAAAGGQHSLFLTNANEAWATGINDHGQLGDNTITTRTTPFRMATGVAGVAASVFHSALLKTDSTLWTVGWNDEGQLGTGNLAELHAPAQIATDVVELATGNRQTLFIKSDGTLWGAGDLDGNGPTTNTPIQIATGVKAVSAGAYHSLILKTDGSLWALGYNAYGQLGTGNTTTATVPVQIATGVKAIAAGYFHSAFIKTDNSLWVCGYNTFGQLGDGTTTTRLSPVPVATSVSAVSASESYTLFLKTDASIWGTGLNANGQFGNGGVTTVSTPVRITGGGLVAPAVPSGLSVATNAALDRLTLNWQGVAGATKYEVWRGTTNNLFAAARIAQDVRWAYWQDVTGVANTTYFYWVTAVNLLGTSSASLVASGSFGAPNAPTFTLQPSSQTVVIGTSAAFPVATSGSPSPTLQWQRLPVGSGTWANLTNAGNYSGVTTALFTVANTDYSMSGDQFRCMATSTAGSTNSNSVTLTVIAPPNAITYNGNSFPASAGTNATVTFTVSATNSGSQSWSSTHSMVLQDSVHTTVNSTYLTYVPPGSSSLASFTFTAPATAGTYTYYLRAYYPGEGYFGPEVPLSLTVVTVLQPPVMPYWPTVVYCDGTSTFNILTSNAGSGGPFTYQWYRDGVLIPGATQSNYFNTHTDTQGDMGNYSVMISNAAGSIMSPDIPVVWITRSVPWDDAARLGDTVYFLFKSSKTISRYDLAAETWLPQVTLAVTPTAFLPTAEGLFLAYGTAVVRRPADLSATETPVATAGFAVSRFVAYGSLVYFQTASGGNVVSFNRTTLVAGPTFPLGTYGPYSQFRADCETTFAASLSRGFFPRPGTSPNDIQRFTIAGDGSFNSEVDSPYHGGFRVGTHQYLTPDQQSLIDNSGNVYKTSDLTNTKSLGMPFDDMAFLSDGTPVVLRGDTIITVDPISFVETGRAALTGQNYRTFSRLSSTYVFGALVGAGTPNVVKVQQTAFSSSTLAVFNPSVTRFTADDMLIDPSGVIHVMTRSGRGVVRWSVNDRAFMPTLPMRGSPFWSSYATGANRYMLHYQDGTLTQFNLGTSNKAETKFGGLSGQATGMVAMDDLLIFNIQDSGDGGSLRLVTDSTATTKYLYNFGGYWGQVLTWQSALRRLYSFQSFSTNLGYEDVPLTGVMPGFLTGNVTGLVTPLRPSQSGTRLLSVGGAITNENLALVAILSNSVLDGAWVPGNLFTIRDQSGSTQVQKWSADTASGELGNLTVPGSPLRIFRLDDATLVAVTSVNGYIAFHTITSSLTLVDSSVNDTPRTALTDPGFTTHPANLSVSSPVTATFTVVATGNPAPTLQWQRQPAGGGGFSNLSNGSTYAGVTTATLTVSGTNVGMNGDQFRCVATNFVNSVNSNPATLAVTGAAAVANDFSGDNKADIIWKNTVTGDFGFWLMNGTGFASWVDVGIVSPDWRIAATADFDGDGKPDILWENTVTGDRGFWLMNGTTFASWLDIGIVPTDWRIASAGDFNGDGKPDILWENTVSGDRGFWLMNGTTFQSWQDIGVIPTALEIVGTGDFNADGKPDIVWENTATGKRVIWFMNGTTFGSSFNLGIVSTDWHIAAIADYDGDGHPDILWENTVTGDRGFWLMNGTTFSSWVDIGVVSTDWRIAN